MREEVCESFLSTVLSFPQEKNPGYEKDDSFSYNVPQRRKEMDCDIYNISL